MKIPLKYNIRNLLIRKTTTTLTALGIAMVVLIFVALTSLVQGLRVAVAEAGLPDNLVVLGQGAISISTSALNRNVIQELNYLPEVKTGEQGEPIVSPELIIEDVMYYKKLGQSFPTPVRGVQPVAYQVHNNVRIEQGEATRPNGGIILGKKIAAQLGDVALGDQLQVGPRSWTIVGIFSANGDILESEIWTNLDDLMAATKKNRISTVVMKLKEPSLAAPLAKQLSDNARLKVKAFSEPQYFSAQTQDAQRIWILTLAVTIILGVAAIFGGMNTMYAAVANRVREIGILRSLGFSHRSILLSFTAESILLALLGGAIGAAIAFAVNGVSLNMMTAGRFLFFSFQVTPAILLRGIILSVLIGVVGGFFPARKAAKLEIIEALR
jgi:putative ABC transport system permease protein